MKKYGSGLNILLLIRSPNGSFEFGLTSVNWGKSFKGCKILSKNIIYLWANSFHSALLCDPLIAGSKLGVFVEKMEKWLCSLLGWLVCQQMGKKSKSTAREKLNNF